MAALPPGVTSDDLDTAFAKAHTAKKGAKAKTVPAKRSAPAPNPALMGPGGAIMPNAGSIQPSPGPAPKDTNLGDVVAGGKVTPAAGTEELPFRLGQTETAAEAPYVSQLKAMLGPDGATATSGLAQYLQNLPPSMAATIKAGIGNEMSALSGLPGAIQTQAQGAGDAGQLLNLLNAAKYQEIYKQGQYGGAPPANTPQGQLYQQVVAGGNALTGGLTAVNPTQNPNTPTTPQQTGPLPAIK